MKIFGLEKLSMVDFEGHLCCTVFTGGCNFKCPFCQNSDLVKITNLSPISEQEFFEYLEKRKNLIDSVCISGGEPTLQKNLPAFAAKIKEYGLLIKLDTNGTNFDMLKNMIDEKLVDYVAMDIKNAPSSYEKTAGAKVDLAEVVRSVNFLKTGIVPYEFRTTLVAEHHTTETITEMAEFLKGADKLYLQHFVDNGSCLQQNLKPVSRSDAENFKTILSKQIKNVYLRGY